MRPYARALDVPLYRSGVEQVTKLDQMGESFSLSESRGSFVVGLLVFELAVCTRGCSRAER